MPRPIIILLLLVGLAAVGYLASRFLFQSSGLGLDEIASRMDMDCSITAIDIGGELPEIDVEQIIKDPSYACDWNGTDYAVVSRADLDRLALALIPKMPEISGLSADKLGENCQSVIYSANIDNLIAQHLVLTRNYAFANYSGLAGFKQAMETEEVDVESNPSACDMFLDWHSI